MDITFGSRLAKLESNFIQALQSVHFYFRRRKINHYLFSPLLLFSCQLLCNLTRLPALCNCPSHSSLSVLPQQSGKLMDQTSKVKFIFGTQYQLTYFQRLKVAAYAYMHSILKKLQLMSGGQVPLNAFLVGLRNRLQCHTHPTQHFFRYS